MWPKEMFEWKQKPVDVREQELKKIVAERSISYVEDFLFDREQSVDKYPETV